MIKSVYRVQCDGLGKEWLSLPDGYVSGTDLLPGVLVAAPTAERAGNWPDERAAQRAAVGAGWRPASANWERWMCPSCAVRPASGKEKTA
jgi:hypothetical protein